LLDKPFSYNTITKTLVGNGSNYNFTGLKNHDNNLHDDKFLASEFYPKPSNNNNLLDNNKYLSSLDNKQRQPVRIINSENDSKRI
jgi:hypothetical protein